MAPEPASLAADLPQSEPQVEARSEARVPRHLGLALVVIAAAQLMIVLDATIVNVALPKIQQDLGFSGASLAWIVTAYSLAFGSLLLLGGRLGDMFGRRRVFIMGVSIFTFGSLLGGFSTTEAWLLVSRAIQGAGAALAAPTALALIATTFPQGPPRNRALGVYAGMSGAGGAIGLLLGGILTTYVSWRWVMFVNVPIGLVVIGLAPFALVASERLRSKLDIPGVITSAAGLGLLVYGLTHAAAGPDGVSHWGDTLTIASLVTAAVLLVSFVFIELHSRHPELPMSLLKSRRRSGAYVMMLLLGSSLFTVFFFVTIYIETVWGYSPIKAGVAWLPFPVTVIAVNILVAKTLLTRVGVRPLLLLGPPLAGVGFVLLSRLTETSTYWTGMLPSVFLISTGMGLLFVPLTLMVVNHVAPHETGAASGMLNTTQQIGGAIGLAAIGTVTWTAVANSIQSQLAAAGATATAAAGSAATGGIPQSIYNQALTEGFSTGLLVAAGVIFTSFFVGLVTTWTPGRVRLSSAVHTQTPSCDEVLGTCEAIEVA
jgi:EmrB/QacA subfamily drug resistance transporter